MKLYAHAYFSLRRSPEEPFSMKRRLRRPKSIRRSFFIRWKALRQAIGPAPSQQTLLFIFGCQRSGTTLLSEIFDKDPRTRLYGEASVLSHTEPDKRLRLLPNPAIRKELSCARAPLIVLKPLVESQNAGTLLTDFEGSKAIWIYRNFKDVALSNINRFGQGNGIDDLTPMVNSDPNNWRSERIDDKSLVLLNKYYSPTMTIFDAAVLFWIVRNSLFFSQKLESNSNLMLCKYEQLTDNPSITMNNIYQFLGETYPGDRITQGTHTRSIDKGSEINLSPEIHELADKLQARLDAIAMLHSGELANER